MNLWDRIRLGFNAARLASDGASIRVVERAADAAAQIIQEDAALEKQANTKSKMDIRRTQRDLTYYSAYTYLRNWYYSQGEAVPPYGDPLRDVYLSRIWREEPIMAGAVYSMTAKMQALRWYVVGRRRAAKDFATLLAQAAHIGGYDWGGFISPTAQDFYVANRGVFWETPREGNSQYGKLADIGHIDALACTLTGNVEWPMIYASEATGQVVRFRSGEYIHFASMPSPREEYLGIGACAVDRALRAVKLLIGLHDYDEEKLSNLPPEGIASVTGLTMDEFNDAVALWKAQRERDKSLTFPQVLWLIGSMPSTEVKVQIAGFSTLPESFNRNDVMSHYISTLAMCFGVDAREFWPISSGSLGTASESEIQHIKAKGKGPGEFISTVERFVNGEADEDTQFAFDTQDIEEDMQAATVAKAWVDAYYPLYQGVKAGATPAESKAIAQRGNQNASTEGKPSAKPANEQQQPFGGFGGGGQPAQQAEQVITKDELMRILADKGVLPEWLMTDRRFRVDDTTIHIQRKGGDDEDFTKIAYDPKTGLLKEERLPPIVLVTPRDSIDAVSVPRPVKASTLQNGDFHSIEDMWTFLKQQAEELKRNIKGDPLPAGKALAGSKVTADTIRVELERWRNDPVLAPYALSLEEQEDMLNALGG